MLRFFIIEWIFNYLNTPQYEMTTQIKLLGIIAGGIVAFALLALFYIICKIWEWFK